MFYLLLVIGLVLAVIFLPRLLKSKHSHKVSEVVERYELSPLEESVYRDLAASNPNETEEGLLYLFCLKPIRRDLKRTISEEIMENFPIGSAEYSNMLSFVNANPLEWIDAMHRESMAARRPPPPVPARAPPPLRRPTTPPRRRPRRTRTPAPPPQPRVERPEIEEIAAIFDFIDEREFLMQIEAFDEIDRQMRRRRTQHFYESKENVHALNSDCLDKAHLIVERYGSSFSAANLEREISLIVLNAPLGKTEGISAALERISGDKSFYGYGDQRRFTLAEVCYSVLMFIKEQEDERRAEMMKRFCEELEDSSKKCGTGHLVRLLNSLQGFGTEFSLKLPIKDEIYSRLSILIQKEIEKSSESDTILENKEALIAFIRGEKDTLTQVLLEEYAGLEPEQTLRQSIRDALNRYTRSDVF